MTGLQAGITIEGRYGPILSQVVSEMVRRDFTLKTIENYVIQIEDFLNTMGKESIEHSDIKTYMNSIKSYSSLQALHFFFREILSNQNKGTGSLTN